MAKKAQKEPARRGRGRPPKLDAERKRGVLSMRVRDNMREALAARAAANQRSISEEAEYLLERAMQAQGVLLGESLDLAFDSEAAGIALLIAQVAHMVGGNSGSDDWLSNPYAFAHVKEGVTEVLEGMRPKGDIVEPAPPTGPLAGFSLIKTPEARAMLGRGLARAVLHAVAGPSSGLRQPKWAQLATERLPTATLERIRDRLSVRYLDGGDNQQRKQEANG